MNHLMPQRSRQISQAKSLESSPFTTRLALTPPEQTRALASRPEGTLLELFPKTHSKLPSVFSRLR